MMKCTELVKDANRSVVEIRNMETDKIVKYVVCSDFDNSKAYGNKWDSGEYYNVNEALGLYQQDMLKAAVLDLYGIKESKVSYERVKELAKHFYKCAREQIDENEDIDTKEWFEEQKNYMNITKADAEMLDAENDFFKRKYKVVEVSFTRTQDVKVKVVMPDDEPVSNAEDYVGEMYDLENCGDIYSYDWDCEDCVVERYGLDEDDVTDMYDPDELWNGCDFPDEI